MAYRSNKAPRFTQPSFDDAGAPPIGSDEFLEGSSADVVDQPETESAGGSASVSEVVVSFQNQNQSSGDGAQNDQPQFRSERAQGKVPVQPTVGLPFTGVVTRNVTLVRLVSEVARAISAIGKVTVEGEVHRPTTSAAGRTYFTLRDRTAQLSVAIPSARQKFCRVKDGERVAVTGTIEFVSDRGQLQLVASEVTPVGSGAIAAMIAEARERMRADGLLDRRRKPLPLLPNCVGILCGADAAVRKDIESVVAARFPGFPVKFLEITVSGAGAVESITAGLSILMGDRSIDVVVLARGGGDATQLLPFSDESLCRAIAASTKPVISAIGHDGDRPLSDEVADHRAGTPSIAAAMVIPQQALLAERIDRSLDAAYEGLHRRLERRAAGLAQISWSAALDRRLGRAEMRLQAVDVERAMERLDARSVTRLGRVEWQRPIEHRLARAQQSLSSVHMRIEGLSPVRVLERGYAVVRNAQGQVLRDSSQVTAGSVVSMTLARGAISATVDSVDIDDLFDSAELRDGSIPTLPMPLADHSQGAQPTTPPTFLPNPESKLSPSVDALDQTVSESQEPHDD
jgi:exodeoxyribonuclease VII large subunit